MPKEFAAVESALASVEGDRTGSARFLDELCLRFGGSPGSDPASFLLSSDRSVRERDAIAAYLIRYLGANGTLGNSTVQRRHVVLLIGEVLPTSFFKSRGISLDMQGHEIVMGLRDVPNEIHGYFASALSLLEDVNSISGVQEKLKRDLNSPASRAVVHPLVEKHLREERLDRVFASLREYASDPMRRGDRYEHTRVVAHNYLRDLQKSRNPWTTTLLGPIAERFVEVLDADFDDSPYSRPASLRVQELGKKYPLADVGREFDLVIAVVNSGDGAARDVHITLADDSGGVQYLDNTRRLDSLQARSMKIRFPCRVTSPQEFVLMRVSLQWTNYDGTQGRHDHEITVHAQRQDLDWETLSYTEPYSLEPAIDPKSFVGRESQIGRMRAKLSAPNMGSFWVYGQRRVGKTSLVKVLEGVMGQGNKETRFIYVEGGEFVAPNPAQTVANLGTRLCELIKAGFPDQLDAVAVPEFTDALSPLGGFLSRVNAVVPDQRFVFAIDEFDRLPATLYAGGTIGRPLFLTLRSLSGKPDYGFILVGGENMVEILDRHGQELNKFETLRVDYFDRENHFDDFRRLVAHPTDGVLEFDDDAISRCHTWTAGNPYFTNMVCGELYQMMLDRNDTYVVDQDINKAISRTISRAGTNSFAHFWDDGLADDENADDRSDTRRRVLIAIARALDGNDSVSEQAIEDAARQESLLDHKTKETLAEYVRRGVLTKRGSEYSAVVPLFADWLAERGVEQLLSTMPDQSATAQRRLKEEHLRISSQEMVDIAERFGLYRGHEVTADHVRNWLDQFGPAEERRLMADLLAGVDYYSAGRIRSLLGEAHTIVVRGVVQKLGERQIKRREILVTYVDGPGKSGAKLAQLYADENNILRDRVCTPTEVTRKLASHAEIQALVVVDDFVGSGGTLSGALGENAEAFEAAQQHSAKCYVVALTGFPDGASVVEREIERIGVPITLHLCGPLGDQDRVFSESSRVFPDPDSREQAKRIAETHGERLVKNNPLGYGRAEAAVVLYDTVPNNSLPILWKTKRDWTPLFERSR